jgi:hypothetical protein
MGPLAAGVGGRKLGVDFAESSDCNGRPRTDFVPLAAALRDVPRKGHSLTPRGICLYFLQNPRAVEHQVRTCFLQDRRNDTRQSPTP